MKPKLPSEILKPLSSAITKTADAHWAGKAEDVLDTIHVRLTAIESLKCDRTARNVDEWIDSHAAQLAALSEQQQRMMAYLTSETKAVLADDSGYSATAIIAARTFLSPPAEQPSPPSKPQEHFVMGMTHTPASTSVGDNDSWTGPTTEGWTLGKQLSSPSVEQLAREWAKRHLQCHSVSGVSGLHGLVNVQIIGKSFTVLGGEAYAIESTGRNDIASMLIRFYEQASASEREASGRRIGELEAERDAAFCKLSTLTKRAEAQAKVIEAWEAVERVREDSGEPHAYGQLVAAKSALAALGGA